MENKPCQKNLFKAFNLIKPSPKISQKEKEHEHYVFDLKPKILSTEFYLANFLIDWSPATHQIPKKSYFNLVS